MGSKQACDRAAKEPAQHSISYCRRGVENSGTADVFRVLKGILDVLNISSFEYRSVNNVGWLELGIA